MTSRLSDVDRGLRAFVARARGLQGVRVTVGVHADDAARQHPSGQTVGEVAAYAEMGSDLQAPSGFLRSTIDDQRGALARSLADAGAEVLGGADPAAAFGITATALAAEVRARVPVDTGTVRDAVVGRVAVLRAS